MSQNGTLVKYLWEKRCIVTEPSPAIVWPRKWAHHYWREPETKTKDTKHRTWMV